MIISPSDEHILKAASALQRGELVAFPTETVYGLGADARSETAAKKIFQLKERPENDPLIVHLADISDLPAVANISSSLMSGRIEKLSCFWPGPLTLILPKRHNIPDIITSGLPSVAVRIPSHPVAQKLLRCCTIPVAAPSANKFSCVSPTCARHVEESFGNTLEIILDGGDCQVGLESTILSLVDEVPVVLRPGAVTLEMLREILGEVRVKETLADNEATLAPGMLKRHYAPRTPLIIRNASGDLPPSRKTGLISFSPLQDDPQAYAEVRILSQSGDLEEAAAHLFSVIREMDKLGLDAIIVNSCPSEGIGRAIMDRLTKASRNH